MSDLPSWARVGAKVVCVRDDHWGTEAELGYAHPAKGDILTIASVGYYGDRIGLTFDEKHPNDVYAVEYFRPLVTIEDDIEAHFAALLDVREPERV